MPRPRIKSALPPLAELIPEFQGLPADSGKCAAIADILRTVITRHRQSQNLTFHPSREVARFFGVCQQTATLAVGLLEKEGLLRRVRGSQTVITGARNITRVTLRAVAGFPMGVIEAKYSYAHRRLARELGDTFWKHHIALDTIPYIEIGGQLPDFTQRLHRHGINFAIWLTPLSHNRKVMLHLEDQGVRNLVVDFNTRTAGFNTDITIDIVRSYHELAQRWRDDFGIRHIIVIEGSDYPRERIETFVQIALLHGHRCEVLKHTPTLAGELAAMHGDTPGLGIALLDERATAEFTFHEPAAFVALARRHRVLYGSNYPEVPFAGHGETRIDRISIDHPYLTDVIASTLVRWLGKDFTPHPKTIACFAGFDVPLWRYL